MLLVTMVFKINLCINQYFELKENKGTEYVIGWNSKGVYTSKFIPLFTAVLHTIKGFGYKIGI